MNKELSLAFIGGGNMASALAAGLIGKRCGAHDVLVIDPNQAVRDRWAGQGVAVAPEADSKLSARRVWILAVKPQGLKEVALACKPHLAEDTLVISVAAGVSSAALSGWLGQPDRPWRRLVRCMPNTPALIGAGACGLMALDGVSEDERRLAQQMLGAVAQVVWVDDDAGIDAVTALSGSGPAYVFLFIEALIQGGIRHGLDDDQARSLALATLTGATQLASLSHESLATLRERVTSKGGTTAAALDVFQARDFAGIVGEAMDAARARAAAMAAEFS
ncbi:pyrroline-5-carboxylate reductase [Allopusillimonas soli]|uniref:Pyrroline-5-carboxylate reductase n=1 Tax=Allopusillimonas soli TaxID=659016 RepID=A0A853FD55_9BURK|nr:pyrroline-5-carboxylate reductase [Allopusillimonas soli]NYT36790.1 pyrroline-5-carboxylate reductase [Allopusillimonas soli]TEA75256.1 pyrroline-5-carboxylate reductase [Allopusillimonas soli]